MKCIYVGYTFQRIIILSYDTIIYESIIGVITVYDGALQLLHHSYVSLRLSFFFSRGTRPLAGLKGLVFV